MASSEQGRTGQPWRVGEASSRSYAFSAAGTLLVAAYANSSLTGFVFLLAFLVWGSLNLGRSAMVGKHTRGLWGSVVAYSSLVAAAQTGTQIAFAVSTGSWASSAKVQDLLALAGFRRATNILQLILSILPPFLALAVSSMEISAARDGNTPFSVPSERKDKADEDDTQQPTIWLTWASGFSSAGVLIALALIPAALMWPTLLAVPYLLVFLWRIWGWATQAPNGGCAAATGLHCFQVYTGFHISLLYLWQIKALRIGDLEVASRWIGVVHLKAEGGHLAVQIIMLVALHVLYAAMGFLTIPKCRASSHHHFARSSWVSLVGRVGAEEHDLEHEARVPLLEDDTSQASDVLLEEKALSRSSVSLVLPCLAGLAVYVVEKVCFYPAVSAVALCCYSMVEPSVFSAVALLISVWALVTPSGMGKRFLVSASPALTAVFVTWHLLAFLATAVSNNVAIPDLLQSIGVYAFEQPPPVFLPLSAQALMIVILGGLSRSRLRHSSIHRQSSIRSAASSSPDETLRSISGDADQGGSLESSFALLGLSGAHLLWHAGFVAVPLALFFVGSSQYDVLHALYLLYLLVHLAVPSLSLTPPPTMALAPFSQHLLLRTYASLHLAATYVLLVGHLPGLGHYLEPDAAQDVLRLLGLWQPTVHRGILPLLAILLLSTVHAGLGRWLKHQQPDLSGGMQQHTLLDSGRPSLVFLWARACVSFGSLMVVLLGYVLILWDCPLGLLGLGYLAICAAVLMWPPQRGTYHESDINGQPVNLQDSCLPGLLRNRISHAGNHRNLISKGGKPARWGCLTALAAFAAVDFLLQYILSAKSIRSVLHISDSMLTFLENVVGFKIGTTGWSMVLCLLRPVFILGSLQLLRFGFALGTIEAQVTAGEVEPEALLRRQLQDQFGIMPLVRRFLILHSSKLVALLLFAAAMQGRSAIGWVLIAGIVGCAPLLGGPRSTSTQRQKLLQAALLTAVIIIVAWMVALYAFQVEWLREKVGAGDSQVVEALKWAGLIARKSKVSLEGILRFKCLVLVAVTLKQRSIRWLKGLPDAVKLAGGSNAVCSLFWPPPDADAMALPYTGQGWLDWWNSTAFARSLQMLIQDAAVNFQKSTRRVLEAVDWSKEGPSDATAPNAQAAQSAARMEHKSFQQLRLVKLAFQGWINKCWKDWGLEVTMASLLVAAFLFMNALSLVNMLFIALGMSLVEKPRMAAWRMLVLPVLGTLLAWQYAVLLGWPPFLKPLPGILGKHHHKHATVESLDDWLGLGSIKLEALWAVFFAFGFSSMQVHFDNWKRQELQRLRWSSRSTSSSDLPRVSMESDADLMEGHNHQNSQAERGEALVMTSATGGDVSQCPSKDTQQMTSRTRASHGDSIWKPLKHSAKRSWSWMDWLRFLFYRHYMDIVLIAVVALCTAENDVIHAAYLAIALLLFRRRDTLRAQGNQLFKWLPVYNFAVMLVTLVYQAPLSSLFGRHWNAGSKQGCNFAHVLGLYKMTGSAAAFSLTARGSLADVVLWAIARLQTRVFASPTYAAAMRVVAEEQALEAESISLKAEADKCAQAEAALEQSRLRHARALRVARLKAGISQSGGSYGVNAALLELQMEPKDVVTSERDQQLQATVPGIRPSQSHSETSQIDGEKDNDRGLVEESIMAEETLGGGGGPTRAPLGWLRQITLKLRRPDRESYICYSLFILLFITDFSILALFLQVLLFCYALLAQPPARLFWQVVLVYTEGILIAQYVYQIPTRLHCAFVTADLQQQVEIVGMHGSGLRGIPIFFVYLATLMHNYQLARQKDPPQIVQSVSRDGDFGGLSPCLSGRSSLGAGQAAFSRQSSRHIGDATSQVFSLGLLRLWTWAASAATHSWEFLRRVCSSAERPLYFVKISFPLTRGDLQRLRTAEGQAELEAGLQDMLDCQRALDIRASLARCKHPAENKLLKRQSSSQGPQECSAAVEHQSHADEQTDGEDPIFSSPKSPHVAGSTQQPPEGSSTSRGEDLDLSTIGPLQLHLYRMVEEKESAQISALLEVVAQPGTLGNSRTSVVGWPIRSLKPAKHAALALQRYCRSEPFGRGMQVETSCLPWATDGTAALNNYEQTAGRAESSGIKGVERGDGDEDPWLEQRQEPLRWGRVEMAGSFGPERETSTALSSLPSSSSDLPRSSEQLRRQRQSSLAGKGSKHAGSDREGFTGSVVQGSWALGSAALQASSSGTELARSSHPDRLTAGFDAWARNINNVHSKDDVQAKELLEQLPSGPWLSLTEVEWHSRIEQDWYAATLAVDLLAFFYAVLFYQAVTASAKTLQDISDDRVVPLDFLGALLLLFFFMVLDRLFYTLGLHIGKAVVLVSQMAVFYWYCLSLFWGIGTSQTAKSHLRVIMLLKSLSFAFSALQLRSGYPPPALYRAGQGRHAFVFMRQINMLGSIGYSVFAAVPFLYELRALLDWSCTATTLTLFDWLKLQDIHTSLFLVTVNRKLRERRTLGERQPRYLKFFQGTLLFSALLILLWAPLIAFSSGNPTYQVPDVVSFHTNATLGITHGNSSGLVETLSYPIFQGGQSRSRQNWVSRAVDFPGRVRDTYVANQAKLLCTAEDSDVVWTASPPTQATMQRMLTSHNATLTLGWHVQRDAPLAGAHGGPECGDVQTVSLSASSRSQLVEVLQGRRRNATLASSHFLNGSEVAGDEGTRNLYSYLWQLRGGDCTVNTHIGRKDGWEDLTDGCSASLAQSKDGQHWWKLRCHVMDQAGRPLNASANPTWSNCAASKSGPQLVAVLERVQGGLIGQTLSSFGIIGLYITVVLAIGRFLRLATQNMRMRIQYEDLPTTKRLVTLCQDIYIARAEGELVLEEELYWALINIYRSSAVMFELTKKKDN